MSTDKNTQTFSFDTVAALVASLLEKGGTLGMKDYELMATLDGDHSASSYDHQFRKVKARAKELLVAKGKGGAAATPNKTPRGRPKKDAPSFGAGKGSGKRGRKEKDADDSEEETSTKKIKNEEVSEVAHFIGGEDEDN